MATDVITPQPEFAGILRQQETFASGQGDDVGERLNSWFDRLMLQAGMEIAPAMVLALCLCSGATVGGFVFVAQENLLTTALASLLGFILPLIVAMIVRSRRQTTMMNQLPPMIDELARAAKTGRSLESCLQLVAEDTPAPLGTELQLCTRRLALGMPLRDALEQLPTRTGLVSTSVLVTALTVHRETGGDLVKVLERLSQTLRDRLQFQGRLRAATAASRATAILMIALPPAVLMFFTFRDPEYFNNLMTSQWGRTATFTALMLEFVGAMWVMRILRNSQRT
ncbi:Bacterial type II secretion system protein F domain protein [Maioricimonas rarisocia]|uniref:Bacterial type II secretion system protein F domain protein n=1 Tax=Maioricimonas rarisocia TaxID=2528026 RepID=A0A517ZFS3_9PLAN|nr:type II secretion system F family protein [Maioricimonas rarisocia]QDU41340.1 Bacterial type II secretion system protein F domain protein [Maioricimonas rarisocia]